MVKTAVGAVAEALGVDMASYLELGPGQDAFVLRAAVGWPDDMVGVATTAAGERTSWAGSVLAATGPVAVRDLSSEARFSPSPIVTEVGAVSCVTTVVYGYAGEVLGLLGAQSRIEREFGDYEADALQTIANVLSVSVLRRRSEGRFRALLQNCSDLIGVVDDKGELLYCNPSLAAPVRPGRGRPQGREHRQLRPPKRPRADYPGVQAGRVPPRHRPSGRQPVQDSLGRLALPRGRSDLIALPTRPWGASCSTAAMSPSTRTSPGS